MTLYQLKPFGVVVSLGDVCAGIFVPKITKEKVIWHQIKIKDRKIIQKLK